MGRLTEWSLDWLDRSGAEPSDGTIDDPLTLLQRIFAAIAGIVAIMSSPAISVLVPNLNATAAIILRVLIALTTLAAVNYVVTAKQTIETISGIKSQTVRKYRFSNTERLVARGVVVMASLMLILNLFFAPEPPGVCDLTATVTWQSSSGPVRPLFLSLNAGGREERYPVDAGKLVAMKVPLAHPFSFVVTLVWSDNSRSEFGGFSGCSAPVSKVSADGRAQINLTGH